MNKFKFLLLGLTGLLISSCSHSSSGMGDIEYISVQDTKDGNWSFVDKNGKIKYADEFTAEPSCVVNGFFWVKEGDGYSLYKAGDKPELVKDCEDLFAVGCMSEDGVIPITKKGHRISIINGNGETVFTLDTIGQGWDIGSCDYMFHEGLLWVRAQDYMVYRYVDTKGNFVGPEINAVQVYPFSEGKAVIYNEKESGDIEYYVINKEGETLFELQGACSSFQYPKYHGGVVWAKNYQGECLFYDDKGEVKFKCPSKVVEVGDYNAKYFTYRTKEDLWGVMDYNGDIIVRAKYNFVQLLEDTNFLCRSDKKIVVLDKSGNEKCSTDGYRFIVNLGSGFTVGWDDHSFTLLGKDLKPINGVEYNDMSLLRSPAGSITTNYVNVDEVVSIISGLINDKGVGKYALGAYASKLLTDPKQYINTDIEEDIELKDLNQINYKQRIEFTALFSGPIVGVSADDGRVFWNDVMLSYVNIKASVFCEWNSTLNERLVEAIQAKGYTLMKKDVPESDGQILTALGNGQVRINIRYKAGSSTFNVFVTKYYED